MKVALTPVLGLPEYSGWSQVFHSSQNRVVCVVTVIGSDAANVGLELLEILQNASLKTALEFHKILNLLLSRAKEKDCQLQLSASFQAGQQEVVIFATYQALVLLKREQKVGVLLKSADQLNLIEGSISPGDRVVLMSSGASAFLQELEQKLKAGFDTDSIVTSLVPQIHRQENSSLCGIVFLQIEQNLASEEAENFAAEFELENDSQNYQEEEDNSFEKLFSLEKESSEPMQEAGGKNKDIASQPKAGIVQRLHKLPKFNKSKISSFLNLLIKFIKKIIIRVFYLLKKLAARDSEYLGQAARKKKIIRVLLIALLTAVPIFAFMGMRWQSIKSERKDLAAYMAPLLERVATAKEIADSDPIQARSNIELSLEEIEVLKKKFANKSYAQKQILAEEAKIKAYFTEISGREEFSQLPTFFDLRLIDPESDFIASSADMSGNLAVFLDKDKSNLFELNIENMQGKKISLVENSNPRAMSFDGEKIFILGNGIFSHNLVTAENKTLKEEGDSNREANFINYFGDFIYIFNAAKRNIYRYAPEEDDVYSDPIGWLRDKQGLDFALVTSVQIDGDLWLATKTGEIKRYVRGEAEDFEIRGLKDNFSSTIYLFSKEGMQNLYVLEPEKSRLVILNKNGDFVKEIKSSTLASSSMIIVNEEKNKAFAISGSLLYEIAL